MGLAKLDATESYFPHHYKQVYCIVSSRVCLDQSMCCRHPPVPEGLPAAAAVPPAEGVCPSAVLLWTQAAAVMAAVVAPLLFVPLAP